MLIHALFYKFYNSNCLPVHGTLPPSLFNTAEMREFAGYIQLFAGHVQSENSNDGCQKYMVSFCLDYET